MFQGFVPRVSRNTRAGLARAVSLPESLLGDAAVVPGAAIVDAVSCSEPANLIADLVSRGTTVLVDNQVWRFNHPKTLYAPRWPSRTLSPGANARLDTEGYRYVEVELRTPK